MSTPMHDPKPVPRGRLLLPAAALACIAAIASLALFAAARGAESDASPQSAGTFRGSEPPGRDPLPAFDLRSYRGGRVSTADLEGRVVLLTLLDAQCTDACPIIASVVADAIDRLTAREREHVRAIAISGDPAEDTPPAIRAFLRPQRAEGRLDYLIGTEAELRPVWEALQLLPSLDSGRDTVHSAPLRVYGRDGVWLATLHAAADLSEENLLHDIRVALAADGETAR